jgi:hypothetical protein
MILGGKFGISQAFNIAYLGNQELFPTAIVATSYGICNIFSRVTTIFAPYAAEIKPESVSEWLFVAVAGLAMFASANLKKPKGQLK